MNETRNGPRQGNLASWEVRAILIVTLACACAYGFGLGHALACMGDDGYYLMLGKSIWIGHPYREFWQVGAPWHRLYPPGYPLLLAPMIGWFPRDPLFWKLPGALAACSLAPLTFVLARSRMTSTSALLTAAWVGFSPWVVLLSCGYTLSEVPFMAASLAALALIERLGCNPRQSPWLAGLATFAAVALRTAGLAIALGGALWLLLLRGHKRWAHGRQVVLVIAAALLFLAPWTLYTSRTADRGGLAYSWALQPQGEPYVLDHPPTLAVMAGRGIVSARRYFRDEIPHLLWLPPRDATGAVRAVGRSGIGFGHLLALIALLGLALDMRRSLRPDHLYLLFYLPPLLVWPWFSLRFVGPLLPLLAIYAAVAIEWCGRVGRIETARPWRTGLLGLIGAVLVVLQIGRGLRSAAYTRSPMWPDANQARIYALGRWMDSHLAPNAVIASIVPANLALVARQPMTTYLQTRTARRLIHRLALDGTRYLFVDGLHVRQGFPFLENVLQRYPSRFSPVRDFPSTQDQLFRFRPRPWDLRPDPLADRAIISPWMTQWRPVPDSASRH